jgi:hypothetical protein
MRRYLRGAFILLFGIAAWQCRPVEGQMALWTDTPGGGALSLRVDGDSVGTLGTFLRGGAPSCVSGPGILVMRVSSGVRRVTAMDSAGRVWRGEVMIPSGECVVVRLAPPRSPRDARTIPADSIG